MGEKKRVDLNKVEIQNPLVVVYQKKGGKGRGKY